MDEISLARSELVKLQRQITEARGRLELTLEAAGTAGSWQWDITAQSLKADARFAALTGQDPLALASGAPTSNFFAGIHPDDARRIRIAVAGILAGAEVFSKDYRLLREDGGVRWIHADGRTVLDENDQPILFHGTLVDVTDRKRTEEQLRVAQTAGQVGTFEHSDGFGTVAVSHQFCRLLGLHPTNVLPVRTINLLVHPDDRPIIDPKLPSEPQPERNIEFRIDRADTGETRWLARRGEYLRGIDAGGLRYIGVIYDITESKRIEEQLRLANMTLSVSVRERTRERNQVWQNSRDLLAVTGRDGIIRDVNPAWKSILGFDLTELIGKPFTSLADDQTAALRLIAFEKDEPSSSIELSLRAADEALYWFSFDAAAEGELIYLYGHNITEERRQAEVLRETEALLRQSQKMEAVGQLTGGLAHDFNNILAGITGSLELISKRLTQGRLSDVDHYVTAAQVAAKRAGNLTNRLLAFSRRQTLVPAASRLSDMVADMQELITRSVGPRVEIVTTADSELWNTFADIGQVENALLNLCINARDAMPEGGKLEIITENVSISPIQGRELGLKPGDYVTLCVRDQGHGMPQDVLDRATEPFFTTKPTGQGTGLGLSMVYGFAGQSGGTMTITSEIGAGTSVCLYLPRFHGIAVAADAEIKGAVPTEAIRQKKTVLLVDDEVLVRMVVADQLDELGYTILEAGDAASALKLVVPSQNIDLLLTDVGLPGGMNGRQLADAARELRPDLPVVFITGYAEKSVLKETDLGKNMRVMTKPFQIEKLADLVRVMTGAS
ncbi:MAG: PAS domain S-box protein [Devosia sp.]|uniref:hybrid sensor histidine kinase/response regulator n=1 Tax=Devosia sp. TaxID=1871048 RepID=UPI003395C878